MGNLGDIYRDLVGIRKELARQTEVADTELAGVVVRVKAGETTGDELLDFVLVNYNDKEKAYAFYTEFRKVLLEGKGLWASFTWTEQHAYMFTRRGAKTRPIYKCIIGVLGDNSEFDVKKGIVNFEVGAGSVGELGEGISKVGSFEMGLEVGKFLIVNSGKYSLDGSNLKIVIGSEEFFSSNSKPTMFITEMGKVLGREIPPWMPSGSKEGG